MTEEASPFHAGERALQRRAGAVERLASLGSRVIRDHLPEQHREFFRHLPFIAVGSVDADGHPRASILAGRPGFVRSPSPDRLRIEASPAPDDPLHESLRVGSSLGILGIEPHTRRRNRVNGIVVDVRSDGGFELAVNQSFGNCPKYIHPRHVEFDARHDRAAVHVCATLDPAARRIIEAADTFFIATAHPGSKAATTQAGHGVDVSHRGGPPGFVRIAHDGGLTVPDYVGNFFFNSLGNIAVEPRLGLLFIDFEKREMLQVAATCNRIDWNDEPVADAGAGRSGEPHAERTLHLRIESARRIAGSMPLRWSAV